MQNGFFHPDLGYWETDGAPPDDIRAGYPNGTIEVPIKPSAFHSWTEGEWRPQDELRDELRKEAFVRVDAEHARYLEDLTGNASQAERDTWARKLLAARAIVSGTATPSDNATLTKGAEQRGLSLAAFADVIIARDAEFVAVVDLADAIRDKARNAVSDATAETVPLVEIETRIGAALETLKAEALAAAQEIQSTQ